MITKPSKGFTLVETLIAIAILMIAIVGPFHAVQTALNDSYAARDYLIAGSLAQEGLEQVHVVRMNNYLYNLANPGSPRSWLYGVDGTGGSASCIAPAKCSVDATNLITPISVCSSGTCNALWVSTTNLYNQASSGTESRFTRSISVSAISATEEAVTVTVSWTSAHIPYTLTITGNLDNWL